MSKSPPVMPSNVVPFPGKLSSGKRVDLSTGQAFDLHRAGVEFPDLWMAFVRAHFANPVSVAFHFGVTERAAEKWWNGVDGAKPPCWTLRGGGVCRSRAPFEGA